MRRPLKTRFIALLSDFGEKDYFAPSLKAVIAGVSPQARTIDITHEVSSFDIRAAGFILFSCYAYFPKGTVFLAVVDPGVAGRRAILLVETARYFFIAPDNGLLTLALENEEIIGLRRLTESRFWLTPAKTTFEGRDRMAPVAAWLTRGVPPGEFGPEVKSFKRLKIERPRRSGDMISGEILYQDKFGNLMTNIPFSLFPPVGQARRRPQVVLVRSGTRIGRFGSSYSDVPDTPPFFLINSQGLVEIAVREGSAAARLRAKPGDPVMIRFDS
jgi:S-adenosylmethionine hydrolase